MKSIIELRKRAKIEPSKVAANRYGIKAGITQDELRTLIRKERRVELAFEEHRFWDLRRWKVADEVLNGKLHGVSITKDQSNSFTYAQEEVANVRFNQRLYRMPILTAKFQEQKFIQNEGR